MKKISLLLSICIFSMNAGLFTPLFKTKEEVLQWASKKTGKTYNNFSSEYASRRSLPAGASKIGSFEMPNGTKNVEYTAWSLPNSTNIAVV